MIQPNRHQKQPGKRSTQGSGFTNNPSSREFEENSRGNRLAGKAQETVKTTFGRISLALKHNIPRKPL